jgi:hypothetical protein
LAVAIPRAVEILPSMPASPRFANVLIPFLAAPKASMSRIGREDAINNAKTKYNQTIITQILNEQLDVLQGNENTNKINMDDRDGLGSYPFSSGLQTESESE